MATCPSCRAHYPDDITVCAKDGDRLLPDEAFAGADTDLQEGEKVGEYVIEKKLGEGGFGAVYRAQHPLIGKTVAIKVLAREFSSSPDIVARFIDEARAVNQIRHRGIIDIFSFGGLPDGRQYFVMELLEGLPLDAYMRQHGRLQPVEAIAILRSVARAVDAAHAQGIAHRDLKPDNVFLAKDDGVVSTKLLDFGVAKLLGERSGPRTRTGTPIGTPHYMSPEQARGINVDSRTDVYSLGVMAYQMLTGILPFDGESVMDILLKQVSEAPKPPTSVCAELSPAFDAPILHMLDKDRDKRPQSLGDAVAELAAAASSVGLEVPSSAQLPELPVRDLGTARTLAFTPRPETLVGATSEIAESPSKRSRALWIAFASVALVLGAFVGYRLFRSPRAPTAVAASMAPALSVSSAPAVASAVVVTEVDVTIDSTPPHADVFRGTEKLGTAPGPIRLPKGTGPLTLTLKAPGRLPHSIEVDTSANSTISASLPLAGGVSTTAPKPSGAHTSKDLEAPPF